MSARARPTYKLTMHEDLRRQLVEAVHAAHVELNSAVHFDHVLFDDDDSQPCCSFPLSKIRERKKNRKKQ